MSSSEKLNQAIVYLNQLIEDKQALVINLTNGGLEGINSNSTFTDIVEKTVGITIGEGGGGSDNPQANLQVPITLMNSEQLENWIEENVNIFISVDIPERDLITKPYAIWIKVSENTEQTLKEEYGVDDLNDLIEIYPIGQDRLNYLFNDEPDTHPTLHYDDKIKIPHMMNEDSSLSLQENYLSIYGGYTAAEGDNGKSFIYISNIYKQEVPPTPRSCGAFIYNANNNSYKYIGDKIISSEGLRISSISKVVHYTNNKFILFTQETNGELLCYGIYLYDDNTGTCTTICPGLYPYSNTGLITALSDYNTLCTIKNNELFFFAISRESVSDNFNANAKLYKYNLLTGNITLVIDFENVNSTITTLVSADFPQYDFSISFEDNKILVLFGDESSYNADEDENHPNLTLYLYSFDYNGNIIDTHILSNGPKRIYGMDYFTLSGMQLSSNHHIIEYTYNNIDYCLFHIPGNSWEVYKWDLTNNTIQEVRTISDSGFSGNNFCLLRDNINNMDLAVEDSLGNMPQLHIFYSFVDINQEDEYGKTFTVEFMNAYNAQSFNFDLNSVNMNNGIITMNSIFNMYNNIDLTSVEPGEVICRLYTNPYYTIPDNLYQHYYYMYVDNETENSHFILNENKLSLICSVSGVMDNSYGENSNLYGGYAITMVPAIGSTNFEEGIQNFGYESLAAIVYDWVEDGYYPTKYWVLVTQTSESYTEISDYSSSIYYEDLDSDIVDAPTFVDYPE